MTTYAHHTLDVYGVEMYLATNRRQWSMLRRKLSFLGQVPESAGQATFATWVPKANGNTIPYLVCWIDPTQHDAQLDIVNTCAHEAAHAAGQILNWVGHSVPGTDEPHAYLVGWLTQWLYEHTPNLVA